MSIAPYLAPISLKVQLITLRLPSPSIYNAADLVSSDIRFTKVILINSRLFPFSVHENTRFPIPLTITSLPSPTNDNVLLISKTF